MIKSLMEKMHKKIIYSRRMNTLVKKISTALPDYAKVLDIGCGDGRIDLLIKQIKPRIKIEGIDVLIREERFINVVKFDGTNIPFEDKSFDVSMLVDVLHHTDDPSSLLEEAVRVTRDFIIIKDHASEGLFARPTLRFMDYVGNAHYGVRLPYNYLTFKEWDKLYQESGLKMCEMSKSLKLYPVPFTFLFDRNLHFFGLLNIIKH